MLGCFNLLPLQPLDGGRALELFLSWRLGPQWGAAAARWAGMLCGALVAGALCLLMKESGGSLWLTPAAAGAAAAGVQAFRGKNNEIQKNFLK